MSESIISSRGAGKRGGSGYGGRHTGSRRARCLRSLRRDRENDNHRDSMTEAVETPAKTDRGGSGRDARKYTDRDSQARGHRRSDGVAAQRK